MVNIAIQITREEHKGKKYVIACYVEDKQDIIKSNLK